MAALPSDLPESFRTGLGHDYDSHGAEGAIGIERSFEPWNRAHLLPDVAAALDGIAERLTRRLRRRRRRLRGGRRRAAAGRSVPGVSRSPATTSRTTPSIAPNSAAASAG